VGYRCHAVAGPASGRRLESDYATQRCRHPD
jgi:hypothetical protein